jgi:hypothetical protein
MYGKNTHADRLSLTCLQIENPVGNFNLSVLDAYDDVLHSIYTINKGECYFAWHYGNRHNDFVKITLIASMQVLPK